MKSIRPADRRFTSDADRRIVAVRRCEFYRNATRLAADALAQRQATCRNTPPPNSLANYVGPTAGMLGVSSLMAAVEEIVLEIVPEEDVMRLRVGHRIVASATVADRALVKLSHVARSYARRHKMRFVDVTRN